VLERISPLSHVDRLRSALLVVQGKNDPRVPQSEAEQIVEAVRGRGLPVWYLLALNEGHGFQKKENRDFYSAATIFFLERQLAPEPRKAADPG
jgi:dipeptidyl aminopeptidase/acylaminoacyl peptidase